MNKLLVCAVAAVAGLALAACDQSPRKNEGKHEIKLEAPGVSATIGVGSLPKGAPSYVTIYPGAEVVSSVWNVAGEDKGGMIVFTSRDNVEAIVDYYKKAAANAGMKVEVDGLIVNVRQFHAGNEKGNIAVIISPGDDGKHNVQLAYK